MRDPRHFLRTTWIVFHALWSMFVLQLFAWIHTSFRDEHLALLAAWGSFALVGAILGAGRAWVLRRSVSAIALSSVVSVLGLALGLAAFGGMFAVCVGLFGEESLVTFLVAASTGSMCLAWVQTLAERPMFVRFGVRLATTIVGFTTWFFGFAALTRGADALGLTRSIASGQASWPVVLVLGGVAGAVLGAITALALPRAPWIDRGTNSLSQDAGVGRTAILDKS